MRDLMGMMGKIQEMQTKMKAAQEELSALHVEGQSGGGMVVVTLTGKADLIAVRIDPALMKPDETEILEDLLVAATADAKHKAEAAMQEKMADITGGLPLPPGLANGLKLF